MMQSSIGNDKDIPKTQVSDFLAITWSEIDFLILIFRWKFLLQKLWRGKEFGNATKDLTLSSHRLWMIQNSVKNLKISSSNISSKNQLLNQIFQSNNRSQSRKQNSKSHCSQLNQDYKWFEQKGDWLSLFPEIVLGIENCSFDIKF